MFLQLFNKKQELSAVIEEVKVATADKTEGKMAPTIFHGLLSTSSLPESEKATPRLVDEARILLAAGTDTTANTLAAITYHLLANPDILSKLKRELAIAIPDTETIPELSQVEGLPYLTAIIQEGLRLHPSVSFRQDRVAPDEDLFYEGMGKKYIIPRGVCQNMPMNIADIPKTPVGMTAPLLSRNEELYPSPMTFDPDRFLKNPRLDRYQLSFSRGSRRCLGVGFWYV